MTQDQGVELLRNKLSCPLDEHASELLAALDYIPLAIAQAAAYINKCFPQMTVASYVRELNTNDKSRAKLLSQAANDLRSDGDASNSILTTWQITFERIREENPSAADLLSFMSFFNPQGVPGFLLYDSLGNEPTTEDNSDRVDKFRDNITLLRSYSLITTTLNGDVFGMHRLVRFATRTWLRSFGGEERWRRTFLAFMSKTFPNGDFNNWPRCQLLLPHVELLVQEEPIDATEARWWAEIMRNAAWSRYEQGLYIQAEKMARGSLSATTRVLGIEHPYTLATLEMLAVVLSAKGEHEEAEQMHRRGLELMEKVRGKEHPDYNDLHTNDGLVVMKVCLMVLYSLRREDQREEGI
jgi:hypothetical protein